MANQPSIPPKCEFLASALIILKPLTLFSFIRGALLALTLFWCIVESEAADKPWITVAVNDEIVIRPNADQIVLSVRIKLEKVERADVRLALQEVRFDKELGDQFLSAFKVEAELSPQGQMIVKCNLKEIENRQGTYTLYIEATDAKKKEKRETISLKIKHPPAVLQAIQERTVDRVGAFPWGETAVNGTQLFLRESSNKSRLTGLELKPKSFSGQSSKPVNVYLKFNPDSLELRPNGSMAANFEVQGDFPLGETKGEAEVTANQLEKPLTVKFEIFTRLNPRWILVVIFIGILLGWILRQYLKDRIERSDALLAGIKVRNTMIDSLENLYPDRIFQKTIVQAKDELGKVLSNGSIEEIKTATTKADEALEAAITELKGRLTIQGTRIGLLKEITKYSALFPEDLPLILEEVQIETQKAIDFLEENRIVACQEKIDQIKNNLLFSELKPRWDSWKAKLSVQLNIERLQPKPVLDYAQGATGTIATELSAVGAIVPSTTIEQYQGILNKGLEVRSNLSEFIVGLKAALDREKEATVGYLNENVVPNLPAPEAIENLKIVAAQQLGQLQKEKPEEALKLLSNADWLTTFDSAWEAAILKQSNQANVQRRIDSGQYTQAAKVAAENLNAAAPGIPGGQVNAVNVLASSPFDPIVHSNWQYATADHDITSVWMHPPFSRPLQTGEIPDEIDVTRVKKWSVAAQDIISAVLLISIGYILFQEDFVGKASELIKIGLWAFGLDITVDKVVEQARALNT